MLGNFLVQPKGELAAAPNYLSSLGTRYLTALEHSQNKMCIQMNK
ncbi:hypothetical protein PARC_b0279 [Pseudoalteromonas arctica A 37-1-2]|uniref:Uncharacterized protein n=1 Tax=Pseudoalteromonas arctica A 37-1-2 TaxID=1117313 RepID=A0A290S8W0_9GAMM|nr:hypothetical protein PARC_b0279 [Pseudoalteromonas arctica A 37-1-2]